MLAQLVPDEERSVKRNQSRFSALFSPVAARLNGNSRPLPLTACLIYYIRTKLRVRCPGLASRILSAIPTPLRADWALRYGYEPVLLESFVEVPRFSGASYQAANWMRLGETRGRGKLEKNNQQVAPLKEIWIYPLHPHFLQVLCAGP